MRIIRLRHEGYESACSGNDEFSAGEFNTSKKRTGLQRIGTVLLQIRGNNPSRVGNFRPVLRVTPGKTGEVLPLERHVARTGDSARSSDEILIPGIFVKVDQRDVVGNRNAFELDVGIGIEGK